jgi:hypothetical protein
VQRALGVVRFLDRVHFRAQQVGAQEVVADAQPSRGVSLEQVKTAIAPEIRQG